MKAFNKDILESRMTFIIDDDLDLSSINLLKQLQRKHPDNVKIRTIKPCSSLESFNTNLFDCKLEELNKSINTCFIVSSNIRLESAIINSRLRSKFLNETFNIVTFGLKSKNNIPSKIVNLSIKNILNIFEGKSTDFSKLIIKTKHPLFILGKSFEQRFNNLENIKVLIKKYAPTALLLFIEEKANSKGIAISGNILPLNSNDLKSTQKFVFVNLQDNFETRKLLNKSNAHGYWINTHASDLFRLLNNSMVVIPALSFYEDENLFVNLEGKPQKTLKGINGPVQARSIRKFFSTILNSNQRLLSFSYLLEYLKTGSSVHSDKKGRLISDLFINKANKTVFSLYPLKSTVEDFYRTNNLLKHSPTMAECSNEVRRNSTNF